MLLTLLIWGWAHGQRSSRQLERLCHRDVTYRIICAGDGPDHATIARFRAEMTDVVEGLFTQVLVVCAKVGLGQLGVVALDGVKIASNASLSANRTREGLDKALVAAEAVQRKKLQARLAEVARAAAAEHGATDAAEDTAAGEGFDDRTPPAMTDPGTRAARIREAIAELADGEDKRAQRQAAAQRGHAQREQTQARREAWRQQWLDKARNGTAHGIIPAEIEVQVRELILARHRRLQQGRIDAHTPSMTGMMPLPVDQHSDVRAAQAKYDAAVARRREREQAATIDAPGPSPKDRPGNREPVRRNITDPQSRMMPLRGGGWVQGFNCQAATTGDGVILATGVDNQINDSVAFAVMLTKVDAAAALICRHRLSGESPESAGAAPGDDGVESPSDTMWFDDPAQWGTDDIDGGATSLIGVMLADAGYLSTENMTCPGPKRLIATGKRKQVRDQARDTPTVGPPPADATATECNAHRLATAAGAATYQRRSHIAETPFGHAKHNLGFRRFTSRGKRRATAEFAFHAMVHNLMKAISTGQGLPAPA